MKEDRLQFEIAQWLRSKGHFFFHVPNGGLRNKSESAKFAAIGVIPGIPDLVICLPKGVTLFLELKTSKGVLSKPQKIVHERLRKECHQIQVIQTDSPDQAIQELEQILLEISGQ